MNKSEIFNIKDKNSQEILLYLQKKDLEKNNNYKYLNSDYRKKLPHKISIEESNTENFPKTKMNQFLNKTFFTYEGVKSPTKTIKSFSNDTNEQTPIISTPQFIKNKFPITITFQKNQANSQFSFSNENNNNTIDNVDTPDTLNYLDFHLHENINISSKNKNSTLNEDNLCHIYLPKKYKDDEEYKSRLYKYLKYETEKNYPYPLNGIKTKNISPKNNLSKIPKRKRLISVRKKDMNKIIFFDNNDERIFNLYKDEQIGIGKKWQMSSLYKNFDNDVESDEEQIEKGKDKMLKDLKIGIVRWSHNKNSCFNYKLLNSPVEIECIKRFSASAEI